MVELDASYNDKITDVNHMSNLQILDASTHKESIGSPGINDYGIRDLKLTRLRTTANRRIYTKTTN